MVAPNLNIYASLRRHPVTISILISSIQILGKVRLACLMTGITALSLKLFSNKEWSAPRNHRNEWKSNGRNIERLGKHEIKGAVSDLFDFVDRIWTQIVQTISLSPMKSGGLGASSSPLAAVHTA